MSQTRRTAQSSPPSLNGNEEKGVAESSVRKDGVVTWDGPDDPENAQNWPAWKKAYHIVVPGLLAFAVSFGTSVYTPALPDVMERYDVSRTIGLLGLSFYTLGLGLGPILTAPLSEGHGRKPVYLISSPLFMLFTLGAGFAKSFATVCVCRFLAAFCGSPPLAVGAGTSVDMFPPQQRAVATALFVTSPFLGPSLGHVSSSLHLSYNQANFKC